MNQSKQIDQITDEDIKSLVKFGYLTVGKLKEFLAENDLPDDALVLVQRIEDKYFEGVDISGCIGTRPDGTSGILPEGSKASPWSVYLRGGYWYWSTHRMNENMREEIARRERGEEPEYPRIDNPAEHIVELTDELKDQYIPVWGCLGYLQDSPRNVLLMDCHY